jgi:enamine deaminase RidA (YjgF/YER057c/UK114 family)
MRLDLGESGRYISDVTREEKLEQLGFPLDRIPAPGANYLSVVVDGPTAYVSGAIPFDGPGNLVSVGKVGRDLGLKEAQKAAALCSANILRVLKVELGHLDRIVRVLRLGGYVNSAEDFTDQHLVVNGASQLMIDVLGEAGRHARTALGSSQLPLGSSVEIDAVVLVAPAS